MIAAKIPVSKNNSPIGHHSQVSPVRASVDVLSQLPSALHVIPAPMLVPPPAPSEFTRYSPSPSGKHESYNAPNHPGDDHNPPAPNSPARPYKKRRPSPPKKYYGKRRPGYPGPKKHGNQNDGGAEEGNRYSKRPNSKGGRGGGHDGDVHVPVAATIIYGEEGEPVHPPERYSGDDSSPGSLKSIYDGKNNDAFQPMMNPFALVSPSESHRSSNMKEAQESNDGFTKMGAGNTMPLFDSFGDFAPPMFGSKINR